LLKNINIRKFCKKLTKRFLELFIIKSAVGANAYRLRLLEIYNRFYHIFHVSLLEPYYRRKGIDLPLPTFINDK
jgi:hypothetical protein